MALDFACDSLTSVQNWLFFVDILWASFDDSHWATFVNSGMQWHPPACHLLFSSLCRRQQSGGKLLSLLTMMSSCWGVVFIWGPMFPCRRLCCMSWKWRAFEWPAGNAVPFWRISLECFMCRAGNQWFLVMELLTCWHQLLWWKLIITGLGSRMTQNKLRHNDIKSYSVCWPHSGRYSNLTSALNMKDIN